MHVQQSDQMFDFAPPTTGGAMAGPLPSTKIPPSATWDGQLSRQAPAPFDPWGAPAPPPVAKSGGGFDPWASPPTLHDNVGQPAAPLQAKAAAAPPDPWSPAPSSNTGTGLVFFPSDFPEIKCCFFALRYLKICDVFWRFFFCRNSFVCLDS